MEVIKLVPDMLLELKKPHPCSCREFRLLRVGGTCRILCTGCGRDMEMDRIKLEKSIKKVLAVVESKS